MDCGYGKSVVADAVARALSLSRVVRASDNPYYRRGTAERIAGLVAELVAGGGGKGEGGARSKLLMY
jgi:hypothetical protein